MELINHPERLDRDTLYELRSMLALNPYFQTARLLMLQNLYLLHDSAFDEELRRAAFYITDRKTIFNMVEAAHYQLRPKADSQKPKVNNKKTQGSRTIDLIDDATAVKWVTGKEGENAFVLFSNSTLADATTVTLHFSRLVFAMVRNQTLENNDKISFTFNVTDNRIYFKTFF